MSATTIVYILTAILSVIVAFLLAHFAQLSSQVTIAENKRRRERDLGLGDKDSLNQLLWQEISEFVDSKQQRQLISDRLTELFNRELENKVNVTSRELAKKYDSLIDKEKQNQEIAWKKYNKILKEQKETEAVIHSIAEGLVVVNAQGAVIMMNPAAEKLLGVSKENKIGKPLLDNLKEEELVSLVKSSPGREDREIELISQLDETKRIIRASTAVIENKDGQTVGMVSVLSDITRQKSLEQLKSDFVATVSHELRTPLVAIDKSISMILGKEAGELSATQEQFLSIAQNNLKRLTRLINDLLDLDKLEQKKTELKPEKISIESAINECIETLNTWAKTKSVTIKKKIQEGLPEVNIDPSKINQVLTNLLGNAVKFTPSNGDIFVEARLSEDKSAIQVSVEDTGVGIAKEDIPKVFNKFYQAGERVSTDISGTGIGLSIAKEIVELHGGRIWVESEKDNGAKFIFTIPLK
jgi:PAS domain S-box-containing protein